MITTSSYMALCNLNTILNSYNHWLCIASRLLASADSFGLPVERCVMRPCVLG